MYILYLLFIWKFKYIDYHIIKIPHPKQKIDFEGNNENDKSLFCKFIINEMLQHNLPVYLNTKDQDGDTYDVEHSLIYKINECTNIIQFWCTDYNYIINMMFYI